MDFFGDEGQLDNAYRSTKDETIDAKVIRVDENAGGLLPIERLQDQIHTWMI